MSDRLRITLRIGAAIAVFAFGALPVRAAAVFPDGSVVRANGDTRIYAVSNGHKRHILSADVLASYGWGMADVREADAADVAGIPDARVVKLDGSKMVFDVTSGARRFISSPDEFATKGFTWEEVVTVNQAEIESIPLPAVAIAPPMPIQPSIDPAPAAPIAPPAILGAIARARALLHAAAPVYPQETRVLALKPLASGTVSADVEVVQRRLQELGFFPADIAPNGVFGPATLRAVKAFQKANGLDQVGRVGPLTIEALSKGGLARSSAGTVVRAWRDEVPADRDVLLAAWNEETDDLRAVRITLTSRQVKVGKKTSTEYGVVSRTEGFAVKRRSGSGVNVQYVVTSPAGYQVLANRFPIFDAPNGELGSFPPKETVYVPYSDELRIPAVVEAGRRYLDDAVRAALDDLRRKGVASVSGRGLIADLTDPDELKNIAIIEHLDVTEFRKTEDKHGVVNKIFTVLATNREDAYRFAGSSAGALGLAQFMEKTYLLIRSRYPSAELIAGFEEGMADHVNAFKAMALYNDGSSAALETHVKENLAVAPEEFASVMAEVRAAAYNGGASRVRSALRKFGEKWQVTSSQSYGIFAETRSYLEKFKAVRQVLSAL